MVVSVGVHTDASAENKLPLNARTSMGNLFQKEEGAESQSVDCYTMLSSR